MEQAGIPEQLKLDHQLCFPLYASARMITSLYTPVLRPLGITYTQYLVFLVLLERDGIRVGDLCCRLYLDNGTLTPVLKKMEAAGYLKRERCPEDERAVRVFLTDKGHGMVRQLEDVPARVGSCLRLSPEDAGALYGLLYRLLEQNGCRDAGSGTSGK